MKQGLFSLGHPEDLYFICNKYYISILTERERDGFVHIAKLLHYISYVCTWLKKKGKASIDKTFFTQKVHIFFWTGWWYKPEYIINELNINSVITTPSHDQIVPIDANTLQVPFRLEGYAYSGKTSNCVNWTPWWWFPLSMLGEMLVNLFMHGKSCLWVAFEYQCN